MQRHYRNLTRLFAALLPACGGGDDGSSTDGLDESQFTQNVCGPGGVIRPLDTVTLADPVDSLELRDVSEVFDTEGMPALGPVTVLGQVGVHCSAATDMAACLAAVEAAPKASEIFTTGFDDGNHTFRSLLFTRGDTVGTALNVPAVKSLLGPIDTIADALVYAAVHHLRIFCGVDNNAGTHADGHVLYTRTGSGCGAGDDINDHVTLVRFDGTIEDIETSLVEPGNPNCDIGRLPPGLRRQAPATASTRVGAFLAEVAELEAASVPAFIQLARELAVHGAPRSLVRAAVKAADDEVRHARTMARQARRFGGVPRRPVVRPHAVRSLVDIALDNAVEGCVRETFGAASAHLCARTAADRGLRRAFATIAKEETQHAALSWSLHEYFATRLSAKDRTRVERHRRAATARMERELTAPLHDNVHVATGIPRPREARRLYRGVMRRV